VLIISYAGIQGVFIKTRCCAQKDYAGVRSGAEKRGKFSRFGLLTGSCCSNAGRLTEGWVSWPTAQMATARLVKMGILCKEFFWSPAACRRFAMAETGTKSLLDLDITGRPM